MTESERILEGRPNWEGWHPYMHGFPGTVNEFGNWMDPYARKTPNVFVGDSAEEGIPQVDKFTQNLINNHALESKISNGNPIPTGNYYTTKSSAKKLANEVLCTHFRLCGKKADSWLNDDPDSFGLGRFDSAWNYYDVNKDGRIDAVGMTPQFLRHLTRSLGSPDL